jgi:hypothetical protein
MLALIVAWIDCGVCFIRSPKGQSAIRGCCKKGERKETYFCTLAMLRALRLPRITSTLVTYPTKHLVQLKSADQVPSPRFYEHQIYTFECFYIIPRFLWRFGRFN